MRRGDTRPRPWLLAAGPVAFLVAYLLCLLAGARFDYRRNGMWQFVNAQQPPAVSLGDLWFLHSQPPGFNAALLLLDRLGGLAPLAWQAGIGLGTCAAIWMVADMTRAWTSSLRAGALAGVVLAILPGTSLYSLWLFYTQPLGILLTAACWAFVRGKNGSRWGYPASMALVTACFLTRSSYTWLLAAAWIALALHASRSGTGRPGRAAAISAAVCVAVVSVLTLRSALMFGSLTQSSWGPENYARAIVHGVSPQAQALVASRNPCHGRLLSTGTFQEPGAYPECVRQPAGRPLPASVLLDTTRWADGSVNYSSRQQLDLSSDWAGLVWSILRADPLAAARVPFDNAGRPGSLRIMLGSSADYSFLAGNAARLGQAGSRWVSATGWIPTALLAAWLCLLALAIARRRHLPAGYLPVSAMAGALLLTYLLGEIGENERFRVEVDPVLVSLGIAAAWHLAGPRRRRAPSTQDRELAVKAVSAGHSRGCV